MIIRSVVVLIGLANAATLAAREPSTVKLSSLSHTRLSIAANASVSADCHDDFLDFVCEVTQIPGIGKVGVEAVIDMSTLSVDVNLLIANITYQLWGISVEKPQVCVDVVWIGKVCVKIDNLSFSITPLKASGTLYLGLGVIGVFQWFKIYGFQLPPPTPKPPSTWYWQYLPNTNKCLDLPGGNTENGNKLWIWDCYGGTNQQWVHNFAAGMASIRYKADPTKCVDVPGGVLQEGNQLQIWDCNNGDNQRWGYDPGMSTIYPIASADASLCMDLANGNVTNGTPVQLWTCDGYDNQKWKIFQ